MRVFHLAVATHRKEVGGGSVSASIKFFFDETGTIFEMQDHGPLGDSSSYPILSHTSDAMFRFHL